MHFFDSGVAMGWGALWMVLWWVLPILGIVALVMWIGRADGRGQGKTALDILKERYARGEIDQAEFERKRRDLEA
ncbi:MAG: SHOCT domain-containing protein [Candidatus Thermoplasmatota archaeon]|nr:SHOCT domain-containing protein [Candidatus Thermoplasmatota archaeon]